MFTIFSKSYIINSYMYDFSVNEICEVFLMNMNRAPARGSNRRGKSGVFA